MLLKVHNMAAVIFISISLSAVIFVSLIVSLSLSDCEKVKNRRAKSWECITYQFLVTLILNYGNDEHVLQDTGQ